MSDVRKGIVTDTCSGDSGGGLVSRRFDGNFVLLGVVSFGESVCGLQSGRPGVYTNVLSHVAWIRHVVTKTRGDEAKSVCTTVDGRRCQFPFIFRETRYDRFRLSLKTILGSIVVCSVKLGVSFDFDAKS